MPLWTLWLRVWKTLCPSPSWTHLARTSDPRGLFLMFEPELTLACMSSWWMEIPTITAMGRRYQGIVIDDLIFFDWLIGRDGSVVGISFFPPDGLPEVGADGLPSALGSLPYVEDAAEHPTLWFSDVRDYDADACVSQDFAASLYRSDASWGLAVNIDWLPVAQRERLRTTPAHWVNADCHHVEPGTGVSLCEKMPFPQLYLLRGWFGSSEGH